MANKSKEIECFNKVIKCGIAKGIFAQNVHKVLSESVDLVDCNGERPDMIIESDSEVIGIEHCQVDMLFKMKKRKAQSMIGIQQSKCERLVEKYHDKELFNRDTKDGTALESILDMVEERSEIHNSFSYKNFIINFKRVCDEHNDNCDLYRKKLNMVSAAKSKSLICLIEMPYEKEKAYILYNKNKVRRQAINGVPITGDMLDTIQNMNGFDIVILCMYCFDDPENKKDIICYYFCPQNMNIGIQQQNINPITAFDLTTKVKMTFPKDMYEITNSGIKFVARADFSDIKTL